LMWKHLLQSQKRKLVIGLSGSQRGRRLDLQDPDWWYTDYYLQECCHILEWQRRNQFASSPWSQYGPCNSTPQWQPEYSQPSPTGHQFCTTSHSTCPQTHICTSNSNQHSPQW
jgi:hypothetical protein